MSSEANSVCPPLSVLGLFIKGQHEHHYKIYHFSVGCSHTIFHRIAFAKKDVKSATDIDQDEFDLFGTSYCFMEHLGVKPQFDLHRSSHIGIFFGPRRWSPGLSIYAFRSPPGKIESHLYHQFLIGESWFYHGWILMLSIPWRTWSRSGLDLYIIFYALYILCCVPLCTIIVLKGTVQHKIFAGKHSQHSKHAVICDYSGALFATFRNKKTEYILSY